MKGIFVTATGTDAGKTYVSALIVKALREAGLDAGYYKAALSGAERSENGPVPGDADYVKRVAGLPDRWDQMVSYVYEPAVSPHLAAEWCGERVDPERVRRDYAAAAARHEYTVMEGSGGIVCPIRADGLLLEHLVRMLGLPAVIVSDSGLGSINAAVLTAFYMRAREIGVKGIVLNRWTGGAMQEDNRAMIERLTGLPVLAAVAPGAETIGDGRALARALFGEEK